MELRHFSKTEILDKTNLMGHEMSQDISDLVKTRRV